MVRFFVFRFFQNTKKGSVQDLQTNKQKKRNIIVERGSWDIVISKPADPFFFCGDRTKIPREKKKKKLVQKKKKNLKFHTEQNYLTVKNTSTVACN